MTTAREDVVAYLRDKLPAEFKVLDSVAQLSNITSPAIAVRRAGISRPEGNIVDQRDDELTVWLISPMLDLVNAEDQLDANLDTLLFVIEAHEILHWTAGERDMFDDGWHAFRLTVPHRTVIEE